MDKPKIRFAAASDAGRARRNNEDALHVDAERGIFLVVDGIGGQAAGEKAAKAAPAKPKAKAKAKAPAKKKAVGKKATAKK